MNYYSTPETIYSQSQQWLEKIAPFNTNQMTFNPARSALLVIDMHRYSSFYTTDLETNLRYLKVEDLVITGIMTNMCCVSTARNAYYSDYRVFFPADVTCSITEEMHLACLLNLAFGFTWVTMMEEIITQVNSNPSRQPFF